jgi:uncharacterized RmlC-like cupin family protein
MDNANATTYGVVQLRELEDDAAAGGFGDTLEARFARDTLGCTGVGVSLQRLKPGAQAPFGHRHERDEEIYVVGPGLAGVTRSGQPPIRAANSA